jgi:indole-3-glycerol phosphate synthase
MTILDERAEYARKRVVEYKATISLAEIKEQALMCGLGGGKKFEEAISKPEMSFICEIKKASPSKGIIDPVFNYLEIAREYEAADAVSCLTEPKWFLGSDEIFKEVRREISIPMLRKDFVVDEYQIYQAKVMGADCVLLICALLDTETVRRYLGICEELGLAALVETHNREEISSAVSAGAKIIGVNNRNLKDFSVNFDNALKLREEIPAGVLYVAESGVKSVEDIKTMHNAGVDAVLVGEALMRAEDKRAMLREMREAAS